MVTGADPVFYCAGDYGRCLEMNWSVVRTQQEIEIAALVRLQHTLFKESCVSTVGNLALWRKISPGSKTALQFSRVDQKFNNTCFHVEHEPITCLDDCQRAAYG